MQNIKQHRNKMKYPKGKLSVENKVIEEANELINEIKRPTTMGNLLKEIGDNYITLYGLCELHAIEPGEAIEYAIKINEGRVR